MVNKQVTDTIANMVNVILPGAPLLAVTLCQTSLYMCVFVSKPMPIMYVYIIDKNIFFSMWHSQKACIFFVDVEEVYLVCIF